MYSSSEFLAAHSNLSLSSSDRSHSEDKEERWDRHSGDEDRSRVAGAEPRCVGGCSADVGLCRHWGFVPTSEVCASTGGLQRCWWDVPGVLQRLGAIPLAHLWLSRALLLSPRRLRSWTSCSSTPYTSRHERSHSPAALPSTYSLDTMPKFAFSSEDESPCVASSKPERPKFVLGDPEAGTGGVVKPSALSGAWTAGVGCSVGSRGPA